MIYKDTILYVTPATNSKYLIKLERGPYEQTYKISEMDIPGDDAMKKLMDETFISEAITLFQQMHTNLMSTQERAE